MSESDREKSKASAADERPEDDGKESIWRRWRRDERSPRPPSEKAEGESSRKKQGEQVKRPIDKKPKRAREEEAEEDKEGIWDRLEGLVPDVLKRTIVGSIGSLMLSEDGLRQYLAELKLPKEVVGFILQHADNTKREFMRLIAREIREFLENTNFYDEIRTILTGLSFEIRTEIRLIPNEQQFVKPEISNRFKVKRKGDHGTEELFDSESEQAGKPKDAAAKDSESPQSEERGRSSKRKAARRSTSDSELDTATSAPEPAPEAVSSAASASSTSPRLASASRAERTSEATSASPRAVSVSKSERGQSETAPPAASEAPAQDSDSTSSSSS